MASGGYYTKDDVRELVAYAAERHIDIVPEFEIPGHSREVLEAYPELACVDENGESMLLPKHDVDEIRRRLDYSL